MKLSGASSKPRAYSLAPVPSTLGPDPCPFLHMLPPINCYDPIWTLPFFGNPGLHSSSLAPFSSSG